jgi:predicted nucleotidyltransferase
MAFLLSDLEDALRLPVDLLSTTALDARFLQRIKGEERLIYERS